MSLARAYRLLLLAYPIGFRERFGAEMERALRDRYRAAAARGRSAVAALAVRTVADVAANAFPLRFAHRETRFMSWQSLSMDVRYAWRMFARNPMFTLLALGALTLGIGANTAIFTIVNGVLLRPLPYQDPSRLVMIWSTNGAEQRERDVVAPLDFIDFKGASAFGELHATYSFIVRTSLDSPAGADQILVTAVTPGMFEMLGRQPARGRTFTASETQTAVIVSHGFWQRRLGADPAAVGRVLMIQNQPRTIVGIMPPDFVFPYKTMLGPSGMARATGVEAWLPLGFVEADTRSTGLATLTRSTRFLSVVGRLKPGVSVQRADAEIQGMARQLATTYPATNRVVGASVLPLHEQTVGGVRPALVLLLSGVGLVLLMACVNLANMLLARSSARQREMAIRAALGAGRARLLRQSVIETLLLTSAGGVIAIAVVTWTVRALIAFAPADMPRLGEVHVDATVLGFTLVLSIVTGLAIGLVPGLAASRPAVRTALQASSRSATAGRGQRRLRAALVVAEISLAVLLTAGAGLLLRSFLSVLAIDPGFKADHLLTLQIALPNTYRTPDRQRAYYADLFARLQAIPGVTTAGGTTRLPLGSTNLTTKVDVEGRALPPGEMPEVEFRRAVHDYFGAMGIPLLRGRTFTPADGPDAPRVVIINERMAQRLLPGEDPIGRRIRLGASAPWTTIVGVIGDVRHSALEAEPAPEMYTWYLQGPPVNPFIVVRSTVEAATIAPLVRAEVLALDKNVAAYDIRPMEQVRAESVAERRFILLLVGAFGALALVMAAVGVYGVMALVVSERTAEIGIRLALGATPSHVLRAVIAEGMLLASAGIAAGLAGALAAVPMISTQLYGIRAFDLPTMTAVPGVLLLVALGACIVPAWRAMRVDPVDALRA